MIPMPDISRSAAARVLAPIGIALTLACGRSDVHERLITSDTVALTPRLAAARRVVSGAAWDTLLKFSDVGDGTERPDKVLPVGKLLVFFSDASRRLIAVDAAGRERWALGPRLPSGDSLLRIEDIQRSSDGRIIALDSRTGRLIVVRPEGTVEAELGLKSLGHLTDVVELSRDRLLLLAADTSVPFAVVSRSGKLLHRIPFPSPSYTSLHALARAGVLGTGDDGRWAFGFRLGNGLVAFRDTLQLGPVSSYPERIPFPPVMEETRPGYTASRLGRITRAALGIAVVGDHSFVLFGGSTADRYRIVDAYRYPSSQYAYSLMLPSKAVGIARAGNDLIALTGGPHRMVLRLTSGALHRVAVQ